MNVLVINGPNLNMLGSRNPKHYGTASYEDMIETLTEYAQNKKIDISFFQSNHEGDIIDQIQKAYLEKCDGLIINAGAYSHYSYAIRDALELCSFPKIEVHISNIMERDEFRHKLILSEVCDKTIYGKGIEGYKLAMDFLLDMNHNI